MKRKATISPSDIKSIRKALGNTQAEMAEEMGVSLGGYQQWEYGKRPLQGPALKLFQSLYRTDQRCAAFFLDIREVGSKIPSISRAEVPIVEKEAPHPGGTRASGKLASRYYKPNPNRR